MDYKQNDKTRIISWLVQNANLFYSLFSGILSAILIFFTVISIEEQGRSHINRLSQNTTNGIVFLLEKDLNNKVETLTQFAKSSRLNSSVTNAEWDSISRKFYSMQPGYQAVGWIDKDYSLRRMMLVDGKGINQKLNAILTDLLLTTVQKYQLKEKTQVTSPFTLSNGEIGIGIYSPIISEVYGDDSVNKQLGGFVGGLFSFDEYIQTIVPLHMLMEHHFVLSIDDQIVYSDHIASSSNKSEWQRQASFKLQDKIWTISVIPTVEFLDRSHYTMITTLFLLGALLSAFVFLAVFTALTARSKTSLILDDRNKVEYLLKNLPGMAYQAYDKTEWPMILVSEGCERLTGHAKSDFETQRILWGKIIHPDDYKRVKKTVREAINKKSYYELEYRIVTKNKVVRSVWERGEAVASLLNEEIILEGFVTDVTYIKKAEKALLQSYAFSDAIVNSMVEAVITIDHKGHIKTFNKAAQKMFGYSLNEVINNNISMLMPSTYASHHDQYLVNYLHTKKTHIIGIGRELEAKRSDGTVFPIHLSINDINSHEERMFVGLIRDITQQREAEDQKRMYIEQMAHADRINSLGEMAAGIAHEVNQPLTAISLFSQSGKSLCNNGQFERLPEIFEKLSRHSHRAGAVLERMQVMTKQGGRQKELIDCSILVSEVAELIEHDARKRNISIKVDQYVDKLTVLVDRVQIQQVLLNLLRNGMEAMQSINLANGNIIELRSELITEFNIESSHQSTSIPYVRISVIDNGSGLASGMINELFTAFSSTKKNGIGIGLSISKSIIEEHGGTIHYVKNTPTGSVFYFVLPIVNEQ